MYAKVIPLLVALLFLAVAACADDDASPSPASTPDVPDATAPLATSVPSRPAADGPAATPAASPWSTRAPLPVANSEIAVAELDGRIYVLGGYPSTRVVSNLVQVYTAATDSWELTTPLPVALHHAMTASANGRLYLIGGETAGSGSTQGQAPPGGPGFVSTVYEYDPATAAWRRVASMPTARSGGATAVVDGKVFVAGGRPPRGADFAVYDPALDTWTTLPDLPTQRNHLAAAAIDGKVYVAGGRFGGGVGSEMTAVLEVYDPARNLWESRAPLPRPRAGLNGVAADGCFYVFGGEGNDTDPGGVFADMDVYDPRIDAWRSLEPIPTPVHGVTGAAYLDGWIHLAGGGTLRGGSSGSTLHQTFRAPVSCG
jgi:N-acetylneuraminic acid mutarotase